MIVRRALKEEAAIIAGFQQAMAMETESLGLNTAILEKGVLAVFDDPSKGFYILAENDGKIVASTMITPEWSDWRNGWFWWIQSVYVIPVMRRKGVFRLIYQYVKEESRANENVHGLRLYVEKNNKGARKTYEMLGMSSDHYEFYEENHSPSIDNTN